MKDTLIRFVKKNPVLVGFALGLMLIIIFIASQKSPMRTENEEIAVEVTVLEAQLVPFRIEAKGYGVAKPSETWQAIASVAGKVVSKHPELESGAIIPEGTLLLALDPSRYELAIAEAKANISVFEADISKLNVEQEHTQRLYELEKERLKLSENELTRMQQLFRSGAVSQAKLDEQKRFTISLRQAVAKLDNALALFPDSRNQLLSQLERAYIQLAQAQEDLKDTRIVAPYDLQIAKVDIELHQFVRVGQYLFDADNLEAAEVEARIPYSIMQRLLTNMATSSETDPVNTDGSNWSAIDAELTLVGSDTEVNWQGRVIRVANGLDAATRASRVIIRVDNPYQDPQQQNHNALKRNMYTRIVLSVTSLEPLLVVPASSVHHGEIWVVGNDNRLVRRQVKVVFEQNDLAVVESGLQPGELVVTEDLSSAIDGTLLEPRHDEKLQNKVKMMAIGEQQ